MTSQAFEKAFRTRMQNPYAAERMFVFGLRCVLNGYDNEHLDQWREVWDGYRTYFGDNNSRSVLDALWKFAATYRHYAVSPTGFHSLDCPCMAEDEYLSMALLSSLQHHDESCSARCIQEIARPTGRNELKQKAWQLAAEYLSLGQRFFPVSVSDVEATLQTSAAMRDAKDSTLH
ncbi:MAG: hypothetical protein AAGA50_11010 [Pseudomonadota bacterium]